MILWGGWWEANSLGQRTRERGKWGVGVVGLETFYWGCGLWCAVRAVVPSYFFLYQVGATESDVAYEWVKRCRFSLSLMLHVLIFSTKVFFPLLNKCLRHIY